MKYSFLWALYRQDKGKAIRKGFWFLFPSIFNLFCFLNFHYQLLEWQVNPKSSLARLISGPHFWWAILFDCIPFILSITVWQRYFLKLLKIWLFIAFCYFLINAWFWSNYSFVTGVMVAYALPFLEIENKKIKGTYIQPST